MSATYCHIQIRSPQDGDVGRIEEGWYTVENGTVILTTADGVPIPGDYRCELGTDSPAVIATRLLRTKWQRSPNRASFNRPLVYKDYGIA